MPFIDIFQKIKLFWGVVVPPHLIQIFITKIRYKRGSIVSHKPMNVTKVLTKCIVI